MDETETIFQQLSAGVNKQINKGMGHTINEDEIKNRPRNNGGKLILELQLL